MCFPAKFAQESDPRSLLREGFPSTELQHGDPVTWFSTSCCDWQRIWADVWSDVARFKLLARRSPHDFAGIDSVSLRVTESI